MNQTRHILWGLLGSMMLAGMTACSRDDDATATYVALLPTSGERTFRFTVTDGSGNTYSGSAKATLAEGDYVVATRLKLTKQ